MEIGKHIDWVSRYAVVAIGQHTCQSLAGSIVVVRRERENAGFLIQLIAGAVGGNALAKVKDFGRSGRQHRQRSYRRRARRPNSQRLDSRPDWVGASISAHSWDKPLAGAPAAQSSPRSSASSRRRPPPRPDACLSPLRRSIAVNLRVGRGGLSHGSATIEVKVDRNPLEPRSLAVGARRDNAG
jgi:hypothetical protein